MCRVNMHAARLTRTQDASFFDCWLGSPPARAPRPHRPDQTGRVNRPTGKGTRKRSTARPAASPADTASRTRLSRSAAYFAWDAAAEGRAKAAAAFQARWALQRWGLWNYLKLEHTYRTPNCIIMSGGGEARSTK